MGKGDRDYITEPKLDVRRLLARFGGPANIQYAFEQYGFRCVTQIQTPQKWQMRGIIPNHQLLKLMYIAKAEGSPIDLYDYIITTEYRNV